MLAARHEFRVSEFCQHQNKLTGALHPKQPKIRLDPTFHPKPSAFL
jgi:hypothetical protein